MGNRMKILLEKYRILSQNELSQKETALVREQLLVQIHIMQHERLIHLIVTLFFALLTILTLYASLLITQPLLLVLASLFLILLIPYIRHYYILENGVQKLYQYYDMLE